MWTDAREELSLLGGASIWSYTCFKLSITFELKIGFDTKKGGPGAALA